MAGVDIREYNGDFEDFVELARRVWIPEYGGRIWFPLPEASFLRDKLAKVTRGACLVAYENGRLVGSVFSVPRTLRIRGVPYPRRCGQDFRSSPAIGALRFR